jgi:hypothetical protein
MPNGVIRTDTRTGRTTAEARRKPRDKAPAVEFRKEMLGKEGTLIGMHATEFSMDGQLSLPRTCPKLGSPHHGTLEIQADQHPSSRSGLFRQSTRDDKQPRSRQNRIRAAQNPGSRTT